MTERSLVDQVIGDNLAHIRHTMEEACCQAGRPEDAVKLLAVTKTVDADRINAAIRLGIHQIGENRVQEYLSKKDALDIPSDNVHLIGHLQTNKVRQIVGQVGMIESVDSLRLGQAISRRSEELGIVTPILVEVNIGGEEAKSGIEPEALEHLLWDLSQLSSVRVQGLMTVPPILGSEKEKRQIFSKMYRLFVDIRSKNIDNINMQELSMGMSGDYREAILEGSTIVRVGSALFGMRQY